MPLALLAAFLLLSAAACGGDADSPADANDNGGQAREAPTPTDDQLEALAQTAVPGFKIVESGATLLGAATTYLAERKTTGGAEIYVRVSVAACDPFICASLDPADYDTPEAQANFKSILPRVHIDNPGLIWDWGRFQFGPDRDGLFIYSLSYVETRNADGSLSRFSANSLRAWYHNGATYVTLEVFGRSSDSPLSQADVELRMTRAEAEKAARDVFAALEPLIP